MFPGVISYQTNPKSYLSLPLSPTPLSSTLLGDPELAGFRLPPQA